MQEVEEYIFIRSTSGLRKKVKRSKSFRKKTHDYSSEAYYFVTIITRDRVNWFGSIEMGINNLSIIGNIAFKNFVDIPLHFINVEIDEFIIMPNHVHGIIKINSVNDSDAPFCRDAPWRVPTGIHPLKPKSLSSIINQYKGSIKRWCNKKKIFDFAWQSRYHDRIIRNEKEYLNIKAYIQNNVINWENDHLEIDK